MVKNLPCNAGDVGSTPGQGTKTPHTMGQRKINKYNAVLALERETLARTSSIFFFPESFVAKWGL